jgi:lipopolysaccharide transport system permease protein
MGTQSVTSTEQHQTHWIENRPSRGFRGINPRELWQFRELAGYLALRDLKVRYKQAVFGVGWAVLQPLVGMVVFTIVFRRMVRAPSDGIPYPVFAYVSLSAWAYLSAGVTKATQSLVNNSALVTKVYFPRLLAPIAAVLPGVLDLVLSLSVLGLLIPAYGVDLTWAALTLPLWFIGLVVVALGVGLWLGTLNVHYRDVNQAITLLVQLWLFISPVAYPTSSVPREWVHLYALNPVVGVIEGFRWSILGTPWHGSIVLISLSSAVLLLSSGLIYFQRAERRFADVI